MMKKDTLHGVWLVAALAGACNSEPTNSGSSSWLNCKDLSDCSAAPEAVACTDGFCVDSSGKRIARHDGGSASGGADGASPATGGASSGGASTGGSGGSGPGTGGSGGAVTGGSPGTGGQVTDAGSGGADAGSGGADPGSGGADAGSGGPDAGSGGADAGPASGGSGGTGDGGTAGGDAGPVEGGSDGPACSDGDFRCIGDVLETCNPARTAFQKVVTCPFAGLCDGVTGQCDVCAAGVATCGTRTELSTCTADGQGVLRTPCTGATPFCGATSTGDRCVECTAGTDCGASSSECELPTCTDGTCGSVPAAPGTECGASGAGGACDGAGHCVYCTQGQKKCDSLVPSVCDANGQWQAGNACTGSTPICLAGACVACTTGTDCPASANECVTAQCSSNRCGFVPKSSTTPCATGAGTCDGAGQCNLCTPGSKICNGSQLLVCGSGGAYDPPIACTGATPYCDPSSPRCAACYDATQCPTSTDPCLAAVCSANLCGFAPVTNGTTCAIGADSGTCTSGQCNVCTDGAARCKAGGGHVPQHCVSGQWVDQTACSGGTPTCVAGVCSVENCYAVSLDSQSAHLSLPNTGWSRGTGDFTLEAWLKPHDAFSSTSGSLIALNERYLVNDLRLAYDPGTGKVFCTTYSETGGDPLSLTSGAINDGIWHHVAVVRSGGTATMYVDGAPVATDTVTTSLTAASRVAMAVPSGYAGSYQAAPVLLGPWRFSSVARYSAGFAPKHVWAVDGSTVSQFLASSGLSFGALVDEAGGDNSGTGATGMSDSQDTPCHACVDSATRCKAGASNIPQSCVSGQWVDQTACSGGTPTCVAGACGAI